MTNDPNVAMQQWIGASLDIVRGAFVDGADTDARARAARVCRVILQMLEAPPALTPIADAPESAAPYQPRPPATLSEYMGHLMQSPQEMGQVLGPLLQALGPAAPMALTALRNVFMRPLPPMYR